MLADAGKAGLRIKEVEITVRYDVDGSTVNPIQHGIQVLVSILKDMEFKRPLYYFTVPGTILGISRLYHGSQFSANLFYGWKFEFWAYDAHGSSNYSWEFHGTNRDTAAFFVSTS